MYHYIKGIVAMTFDGGVVLEAGGIGYQVFLPDNSPLYLDKGEKPVLVYTSVIYREDDVSIYGFPEKESLELFQKLRTVNGVGAKAALAILSLSPMEVKKAIVFEDAATLTRANGIGKKTAQRIVLELKDKLDKIGALSSTGAALSSAGEIPSSGLGEAIDGLVGLGYSRSEAMEALGGIEGEDLPAEEYIKQALKKLSRL